MAAVAVAEVAAQLPVDTIICGDALEVLRSQPDASVDAVVTDPPYGLGTPPDMVEVLRAWLAGESYEARGGGFMGKQWDAFVPGPEYWRECLRVLKPGGHAFVFAGTRTWDVMGLALRLAGFQLRDTCQWLYGSGFPKSHNLSGGRGTALKPAWEPIILARKPLVGTVAENVLAWGTGALNVDACRVAGDGWTRTTPHIEDMRGGAYGSNNGKRIARPPQAMPQAGRWPPNLVLTHSATCGDETCAEDCPVRVLGEQSGVSSGTSRIRRNHSGRQGYHGNPNDFETTGYGDTGTASRFFPTFRYQAKASRRERNAGCEGLPVHRSGYRPNDPDENKLQTRLHGSRERGGNGHPTVKPLALMSWLITLITPPGGIVLDCFAGSGTTLVAAKAGGWHFIGVEREAEYVQIAEARLAATATEGERR